MTIYFFISKMTEELKQIYDELNMCYDDDIERYKKLYLEDKRQRKSILQIDVPWKKLCRSQKIAKIYIFMNENSIDGDIDKYSFKQIKYNKKTGEISSLKHILNTRTSENRTRVTRL